MSQVQSVLFDRSKFNKNSAAKWLRDHGFRVGKVDVTSGFLRYRQQPPSKFADFRSRKIEGGKVVLVFGFNKKI